MTATMRAIQVIEAGAPFSATTVAVPEPGPGQVRVRVRACGVCGGDAIPRQGLMGVNLPRTPGHEVAGDVDAVGAGVTAWQPGDRVGIGWHGGSCFTCAPCRQGDLVNCVNRTIVGCPTTAATPNTLSPRRIRWPASRRASPTNRPRL